MGNCKCLRFKFVDGKGNEVPPDRATGCVIREEDRPKHRGCGPKKKRNEGKR